MARTGLRMMPTFPSSPLKFRTAGFPRYGFKASMSDRACPQHLAVKLAPSIPARRGGLLCPSPVSDIPFRRGSESTPTYASTSRCARGPASLPQGSLAPVRVMLSRSLIAYYDPIRQSRRHTVISRHRRLYTVPSLCGSAEATRETFPTFPAVPSTRAADPTPVGPLRSPVCIRARGARLPRMNTELPPTAARLCQQSLPEDDFRRCIIRFMLRPACLPGPPGWLQRNEVICSPLRLLRYRVIPAFDPDCRQPVLGIRLDSRTGNLLSSGLSPDWSQQLVRLHAHGSSISDQIVAAVGSSLVPGFTPAGVRLTAGRARRPRPPSAAPSARNPRRPCARSGGDCRR